MGSVIDYIECPNCKHEAYSDFYYKTGEEYVNCNNCGYHYSATIKNRDKALNELTEEDWEIKELKNPYGSYRVKYYDSIATQCGSFESEEQYIEFISFVESFEAVEFASMSQFINGEIVEKTIIDNGPKFDSAGFTIDDRNEN